MIDVTNNSHVKIIRCPLCSIRLMDAKSEEVENVRAVEMKETQKVDLVLKCPRCRKKIGLVFKD